MIDFYNLIVHFIRSLSICTWSLFLLLYVVVQFYPWFEFSYLPLFSRNRCVTSLKTAVKETKVRVKIVISLLRAVVQNWNFDLSAGNLTGKLINLGFPRCITNSELDSRGKRQGLDNKQPNWNTLWKNVWRDKLKQTRLRSETHWKLLLYLDFRSNFEATSPNWFNVFCQILLRSIFRGRMINKNKPKNHQLIPYLVHDL